MNEEEKVEVKPEEVKPEIKPEVKPEVKPEEEKPAVNDEEIQAAAEKVLKAINEKMATKKAEAEVEKKKTMVFDVKINENRQKVYTTRKGVDVTASLDEARHINAWFKSLVSFKRSKSPDAWYNLKREADILEKMAISQKLEPLNTVTAGDGGVLVPTIMHNMIVPFLEDIAKIKQNSRVIDMTGVKTLDLPNIEAGAYVGWNSETAQKTTTSMVFGHQTLTPYILAGIIVITQQLIDDAPFAMLQIISQELARCIAKAEDAAFASGSGTGQPTGIDTYTPIYTIGAGAALAFQHFHSAFYGMPQSYRESNGLRWLMHRNNMLITAGLADTAGRPIFDNLNPMSNMTNGTRSPQILGIPVIENNDISDTVIYLVDLQYYWIGQSRGLSIDVATEATIGGNIDTLKGYYKAGNNLWERNEIAIRAEEKIDGELVTTRALTTITATNP